MMDPMSDDAAYQSLRGFISLLDRTHPGEVVRIAEPVDLAVIVTLRRPFPMLFATAWMQAHARPL